jgi:hypothetical protein
VRACEVGWALWGAGEVQHREDPFALPHLNGWMKMCKLFNWLFNHKLSSRCIPGVHTGSNLTASAGRLSCHDCFHHNCYPCLTPGIHALIYLLAP